ncbi:MAG: alpha/beta hydrolase, partial [Hyphomicrobium sp.]
GASSTNLIDCARATAVIGKEFGPLSAIVAHSFGGMISLVAAEGLPPMPYTLNVPRIALVACPNRLLEVTGGFGDHWGLTEAGRRAFERRLERVGGRPLDHFTLVKLLKTAACDALIIHDREDRDVSFRSAEEIVSEVDGAELVAFDGFGHNNILFAPPVMRTIASYVSRDVELEMAFRR